jgi:hypothetical protein
MKHGACQNPGNDPDHRYFLPRSPHRAVLYTSFERIPAEKGIVKLHDAMARKEAGERR